MRFQRNQVAFGLLLATALMAVGSGGCADYPECGGDDDCSEYNADPDSEGYGRNQNLCVDGTCRQCRADGDCEAGFECRNNACAAIPDYCATEGACNPPGRICVNNRWRPGCSAQCSDCGSGQRCNSAGQCEEDVECRLDSDCVEIHGGDPNWACQNGACVNTQVCGDREFEVIYFDFDESVIRSDQEDRLDLNVACMNLYTQDEVSIEGHCDERGTDGYNMALGERRARAARTYMERAGVDEDRMDTISYGESRPTCRQNNESCWRQNRRAEFAWE